MNRINLAGQRFGRLTVLEFSHTDKDRRAYWIVKCDCGQIRIVYSNNLKIGRTKSCGCLNQEKRKLLWKTTITHGMSSSREYETWVAMKTRCTNKKSNRWKIYGGRGITVCKRWRESFEAFYADMGPRPPNTSIDRINNNGNYVKSNCRWATQKEQQNNRRNNNGKS